MNKYKFKIEKSDFTDRCGRNLRLYVTKDGVANGTPLLNRSELKELKNIIEDFLNE